MWTPSHAAHLAEKRLKDMMIGAIDQPDLDVGALEPLRRGQPGETATNDHHLLCPCSRLRNLAAGEVVKK